MSTDIRTTDYEPDDMPAFAVHDEASAAWAADRVLSARERLARIKAQCAALVREAEQEADDAATLFLPMLEQWAQANPPRKGKTIKLPTGSLSFRTVPGGPRLIDHEAALAWARENKPAIIEVTERVTITALRGYIEAAGEVPAGVEVVPAREAFDVK